jgi:hypothetical protein
MSITIKLDKVYRGGISGGEKLKCLCKVTFRNSLQIRSLNETDENVTIKSLSSSSSRLGLSSRGGLDGDTAGENDELGVGENERLLAKTNEHVVYQLGDELNPDDFIEIECFKNAKFSKKFVFNIYINNHLTLFNC